MVQLFLPENSNTFMVISFDSWSKPDGLFDDVRYGWNLEHPISLGLQESQTEVIMFKAINMS